MKKILSASLVFLCLIFNAFAADGNKSTTPTAEGNYAYYGFEPEIVTNYISSRKKLGFVRLGVELMVKDPEDLVLLERHDPLLRAAIIEVLGNQVEDKIKSLTGREDIRRECFDMVNSLLVQETGKPLVVNLLFTSYLYD